MIEQIHVEELSPAELVTLSGVVLHVQDDLRYAEVENRKTHTKDSVAVMSIILADGTGPVVVDFWRELAENVHNTLHDWISSSNGMVGIRLSACSVRSELRTCVPRSRKLVASQDCLMTKCDPGLVDEMTSTGNVPSSQLYTADFGIIESPLPFQISIVGIMPNLSSLTSSRDNVTMRQFKLHDRSGKSVSCMAFGRHAENEILSEGAEVVVYFAVAQAGIRGEDGHLWIYDLSHIVLRGLGRSIPRSQKTYRLLKMV